MRLFNMELLENTLQILKVRQYCAGDKTVKLKLSHREMETANVLLPPEIEKICNHTKNQLTPLLEQCKYDCENIDSYTLARKRSAECSNDGKDAKEVLVLNFANPVNPGGGVRRGARAQEEDLCRTSSLLLSLESRAAQKYYTYNRKLKTNMGSDALIFTPKVEIIKDAKGELLDETVIVAVMTCAAPMITSYAGIEGMSEFEYQTMLYRRIVGMLKCAAYYGYRNLVLGAWGCGAFGNNARLISALFKKALKELDYHGMKASELFQTVDFAVRSRPENPYNFNEFYQRFGDGNFYN